MRRARARRQIQQQARRRAQQRRVHRVLRTAWPVRLRRRMAWPVRVGRSEVNWRTVRELEGGVFLKRYKRFFADVEREGGSVETVHCANSGSMLSCLEERSPAFTLDSQNPDRKLRHSLELLRFHDGFACLNTARANQIVEVFLKSALEQVGPVAHPQFQHLTADQLQLVQKDFHGFGDLKREAVFQQGTRFDFSCRHLENSQKYWIEVKSVSLKLETGNLAFPDAKTERGQKHLADLTFAVTNGHRSMLMFVCMRSSEISAAELARSFQIAGHIDPVYLKLFHLAIAQGVQIRILVPDISPLGFRLRGYFKFAGF